MKLYVINSWNDLWYDEQGGILEFLGLFFSYRSVRVCLFGFVIGFDW